MATELSQNWQKQFKEFDKEATRAASLGQVHKAVANKVGARNDEGRGILRNPEAVQQVQLTDEEEIVF